MENDRSQVEEIKSRIDIVSIIERYVTLKNAGKNHVGLCPFHNEKTPSFVVNPALQIYKCFGCDESGDVIKFLQEIEHIEFLEALEKLAKEAGIEIKKQRRDPNSIYNKIQEINKIATEFYHSELKKDDSAKKYLLKERGIKPKYIRKFMIGYAKGNNTLLKKLLSEKKFTEKELSQSGLFTEKNAKLKDRFFQRIIFPIYDHSGNIAGFTGRSLPSAEYGPKYLHTPETILFKKSSLMYGLYQGRSKIREEDLCIICEGTTDVIAAHQAEEINAVAPLGTAISTEQLKLASRYSKNILLILDSDEAGEKALERYFTLGIPLGLTIYTNSTKPYKDLDELVKKDPKLLKHLIDKKKDLFSQLIIQKLEKKNLEKHEDYKEIITYISYLLSHIKEESSYDFFLKKAEKLTTIKSRFFNTENEKPAGEIIDENIQKKRNKKIQNEIFLLQLCLYFENYRILETLDLRFILDKEIHEILKHINKTKTIDEKELLKTFPKSEKLKEAILESSRLKLELSKQEKYVLSSYNIIKKENIENLITRLKRQEIIEIEKGNEKKVEKIEKEIQRLKKLLN